MSRFLMIDIGAGTMDILYYDDATDWHYKAVVPSPARQLAAAIQGQPGNLLVTGREMGGSPVSGLLKKRAKTAEVVMSRSAAATIHHDPEKALAAGIRIVSDEEAEALRDGGKYTPITLADIDPGRIAEITSALGVPFSFDAVVVCAQDHGRPPHGVGHLDFRHNHFKTRLDREPSPHTLLYEERELPPYLSRLGAIARSARELPTGELYLMDSGMAAILGASMDARCRRPEPVMVLDIATSHTVGAVMEKDELSGFFEYHTQDVTPERLDALMRELADGRLSHEQILKEGGHGAYIRKSPGFSALAVILATGPKRRLLAGSTLPILHGAPWGDNMMTGTVGLLEALRRRKGLEPMTYV
jgi:uncharacterized protein (DUF1786 family)